MGRMAYRAFFVGNGLVNGYTEKRLLVVTVETQVSRRSLSDEREIRTMWIVA
jgi:hypothetical protein